MSQYKFYKNNEEAWVAMFEAIKKAESSIYWESYILNDDTSPYLNFFELIKNKAKKGVEIKIVLDGFGSVWFAIIGDKLLKELRSLGVEVLFFYSWFHRIHRKVLIVDEKEAFLGGVNIANSYRKWLDLHIYLNGKKIVKTLLGSFANSYFYSGGKNKYLLSLKKNSSVRKAEMWLLDHFPNSGRFLLKKYYKEKIALAERTIVMVTPYFAPKGWLIKALRKAVLRGVSVEILIPMSSDLRIIDVSNHMFAHILSKYGVRFYLVKQMIHAKALLIDNKEGLVGSNNLDTQSFDFNIEASLSFKRKDMVNDLRLITEGWKNEAIIFDGSTYHDNWLYRPVEYFIEKFAQYFF